ncbi:MAG: PilZ domain-containing protein [Sphingomicrobium sp.]
MTTDHRSEWRSNVFLTAVLVTSESSAPVHIRNLSPFGVLIEGAPLPSVGTRVRLLRGQLSAEGQLAWEGQGHAGVKFESAIDVNEWVRRVGNPGQQRVDAVICALRAGEHVHDETSDERSQSLAAISAALDESCARLCGFAGTSVLFGEEILKLDAIARSLRDMAMRPKA